MTLTVLLLLGLYVGLFVLTGIKTKSWPPRALLWILLLSPAIALTWDMPLGYYRFKALCLAEGGLRVYEANPPQATVLRLDAEHFDESTARSVLARFPVLEAVETRDVNFPAAKPRAYARYERDPLSSVPTSGSRDTFRTRVTSLDQVQVRPGGAVVVSAGPSRAEYILTKEYEDQSVRMRITRQWLRKVDGSPVARATSIAFAWTNEQNTLFGKAAMEYCGDLPGKPDVNGHALFALVAKAKN